MTERSANVKTFSCALSNFARCKGATFSGEKQNLYSFLFTLSKVVPLVKATSQIAPRVVQKLQCRTQCHQNIMRRRAMPRPIIRILLAGGRTVIRILLARGRTTNVEHNAIRIQSTFWPPYTPRPARGTHSRSYCGRNRL